MNIRTIFITFIISTKLNVDCSNLPIFNHSTFQNTQNRFSTDLYLPLRQFNKMKPILCVGLVCEDTIVKVQDFPKEDTDQRTLDQWKTRGGNASNMSTVLANLGFDVE